MSPARPRVGWRSGLTPSCVRAMLARRPASRRWRSTGGAARCAWCVRRGTRKASRKYPRRYFRPQGVAAGALRLAGRARSALAVGHGPPAEPRPARRADHLRAEGPSQERAGRVHPGRRAAREGARREALRRPRARHHGRLRRGPPRPAARAALPLPRSVRLDPRVPPAVARAPPEGLHPRADRRAGAHVDRAPAGGPAPERRPAEGVGAAACEGARGAANAARVPGGAPPGVRRHAAGAWPAFRGCRRSSLRRSTR